MRWVKIDGKGLWHFSMGTLGTDTVGGTVCGKEGMLVPAAEPDGRICAACRKFAEGDRP